MQYALSKISSFHCLSDKLFLHNSGSNIFKVYRMHCRETKLICWTSFIHTKCHFWIFTIPTNRFVDTLWNGCYGLLWFYKWLNRIFGFNMVAYSKCSKLALGYDYLVSQLTNFVISVKISVRVFVWCWADKIIESRLKLKGTNQKPLVLNLDEVSIVRYAKIGNTVTKWQYQGVAGERGVVG